jgi:putative transposase
VPWPILATKSRAVVSPTFLRSTVWDRRPNVTGRPPGKGFLSRHRDVIVAVDFFTVEAWTRKGLTRFLALFFIDFSSRRVEISGLARQANGLWMSHLAQSQ